MNKLKRGWSRNLVLAYVQEVWGELVLDITCKSFEKIFNFVTRMLKKKKNSDSLYMYNYRKFEIKLRHISITMCSHLIPVIS